MAYVLLRCIYNATSVSFAGILALVIAAAVDMALMPRSRFHTWRSLLLTYLTRRACQLVGWYTWRRVSANYSDFYGAQERFVLETLKRNAESEYGRQHRFSEIHSLKVCIFALSDLAAVTSFAICSSFIKIMSNRVRLVRSAEQHSESGACMNYAVTPYLLLHLSPPVIS